MRYLRETQEMNALWRGVACYTSETTGRISLKFGI